MRPLLALIALLAVGCATSAAFRAGERAERRGDHDRAVLEYARAVREHPDDARSRTQLRRARLRAAEDHTRASRRLAARGLLKEAIAEMRLALELAPDAASLRAELLDLQARDRAGTTESLDAVKARARERALPGLVLGPEAAEPLGLTFRNAPLKEAYQALGQAAGVNFVFDPALPDAPVSLDLREVPFEQALAALGGVGRAFHRALDARVVMVVPDTPTKRREYEQQVVRTFFLSNADLKETIDLLRIVLGARRVAPVAGANALTINDTPDKVAAAERIIDAVDKRRAEVVVEVEILEVNRTRLKQYGIEVTSGLSGDGIAGAAFPDATAHNTLDQNPYQPENILVTSLPGVIYRLLQTDGTTRLLANPQLRTTEGQTAQARFGDQVPVPVTQFSAATAGTTTYSPVTSFEYKNVGVNIDITPRVHHDGDVTLALKLEISAKGAFSEELNAPSFNSRTVNTVIRLRDGETTMLAGLIRDEERRSLTGLPGLASVPLLGRLFGANRDEAAVSDIVMTLTPHVVRGPSIQEQDLRSFQIGGEAGSLTFETPTYVAPSPAPSPRAETPRIEPVRPPAPVPGLVNPQPSPSPALQ